MRRRLDQVNNVLSTVQKVLWRRRMLSSRLLTKVIVDVLWDWADWRVGVYHEVTYVTWVNQCFDVYYLQVLPFFLKVSIARR